MCLYLWVCVVRFGDFVLLVLIVCCIFDFDVDLLVIEEVLFVYFEFVLIVVRIFGMCVLGFVDLYEMFICVMIG